MGDLSFENRFSFCQPPREKSRKALSTVQKHAGSPSPNSVTGCYTSSKGEGGRQAGGREAGRGKMLYLAEQFLFLELHWWKLTTAQSISQQTIMLNFCRVLIL